MPIDHDSALPPADIRRRAEERIRASAPPAEPLPTTPEELQRLLHELRVHQIELEMQNDELRRTQAALDAAHQRYLDLYDHAPVSYLSVSQQGRIQEANQTAGRLLNIERGALITRPFVQFIDPLGQDTFYLETRGLMEAGGARAFALPMRTEAGAPFWGWVEAARADGPDGTWTLRITISDITERKQIEHELASERALLAQRVAEQTHDLQLANAELMRADRMKDEFLATMSHELRSPLNAVLGFAQSLQEQTYGPLSDSQQRAVRLIEESGRDLLALINDILDLARIGAGKLTITIEPIVVTDLCQSALRMIATMAERQGLSVAFSCEPAVTILESDMRRLKQILINLLMNAVKFTPSGGAIGLEVVGDPERRTVDFTVWDTGIGIAEADLAKLFQPFVQVDSTLARQYTGSGLGLALVSQMTTMLDGSVAATSEVGVGSRFVVTLPWRPFAAPQTADRAAIEATRTEEESRPSDHDSALILIAEDNLAAGALAHDYLVAQGYRVEICRTGAEVVAQSQALHPSAIVMAIQMPDLDGLSAIRLIRADAQLRQTPIIVVTALAMSDDRERCIAAGANHFLSKPVHLRALLELIGTAIKG